MADFLDLACLTYGDLDAPRRWSEASALTPSDVATAGLAVAAALGDATATRRLLEAGADPNEVSGPRPWTPLTYLAYSRVAQTDAVGTAALLLEAGADPRFSWGPWDTPFTVLTGCFGEGEMGPGRQPRHPQAEALAAVLLEHGADPNDEQTLYNRMFGRDDSHLRFLLTHGLDDAEVLAEQVEWARDHGFTDRVTLLAEHGHREVPARPRWPQDADLPAVAGVGTPQGVRALVAAGHDVNARFEGRTALHHPAWMDDVEMVRVLLDAGADPSARDDRFDSTPLGWAEWSYAERTAALLRPLG